MPPQSLTPEEQEFIDRHEREWDSREHHFYKLTEAGLRDLKRREPALFAGLGAAVDEPWKRRHFLSRTASWSLDPDGDQVRLHCTHGNDGGIYCHLSWKKPDKEENPGDQSPTGFYRSSEDARGRPVRQTLHERLLAGGAESIRSRARSLNEEELRRRAAQFALALVLEHLAERDVRQPVAIDDALLAEVRAAPVFKRFVFAGDSKAEEEHVNALPMQEMRADELLPLWAAEMEWRRGDERMLNWRSVSAQGVHLTRFALNPRTGVGRHRRIRPGFDRLMRPLGRMLARLARDRRSRAAWAIREWLMGARGVDQRVRDLGHRLAGWRRVPDDQRA